MLALSAELPRTPLSKFTCRDIPISHVSQHVSKSLHRFTTLDMACTCHGANLEAGLNHGMMTWRNSPP